MIKEFEKQLIERYKRYLKDYNEDGRSQSSYSYNAGHLQEISWVLHELLGWTDKDMRALEVGEGIVNSFIK